MGRGAGEGREREGRGAEEGARGVRWRTGGNVCVCERERASESERASERERERAYSFVCFVLAPVCGKSGGGRVLRADSNLYISLSLSLSLTLSLSPTAKATAAREEK